MQTTDIYNAQSQVAKAIAAELKTIITPDEKQLIEKTPTYKSDSITIFTKEEEMNMQNIGLIMKTKTALENAEDLYYKALEYDSTFAQAYTGLARVYWDKHYFKDYLSKNFMDSVLILCDIALDLDNQLSRSIYFKGKILQ